MNAYHIYYQTKESKDPFDCINYLVQAASILFWKKNHGSIKLYCNSYYLKTIKKWGLNNLYDEINTDCLDNIIYQEYLDKYWSFCKIYVAKEVSKTDKEFVILDTDMWIQEEIKIDKTFQFIGYHEEQMFIHPRNPYISPQSFLSYQDVNLFNWDINPINCAFLYLNSKDLIDEWYKWVIKIIERNKNSEIRDISADTIFIEQRILPTIAHTLHMKVGTLIPNVYFPHIPADDQGNEWTPKIGFDEYNQYMTWNVKHVWGLKKMYNDLSIRDLIIQTVSDCLDSFFENWKEDLKIIYDSIQKECYPITSNVILTHIENNNSDSK